MADGPTFERPPVVEVALGVQFQPVEGLTTPSAVACYWESIRDREQGGFPRWTQHPPLRPTFETFGDTVPRPFEVVFDVKGTLPPARSMFRDETGTHLIQVQPDRFVQNWRRHDDRQRTYPRYPSVRGNFERSLEAFVAFLETKASGSFVPNQCEVTYVNHVERDGAWADHGQLDAVLAGFSGAHSDDFLDSPEGVDLNLRYRIPGDDGAPVGRLHVVARPVFRQADREPLFRLDLTARCPLDGGGVRDVLAMLDRGHDFLVRAFRSITTRKMHEVWGLKHE